MIEKKVLCFDLEIACAIPEGESWDGHHPLGISVAALYRGDLDMAETIYGNTSDSPAHRMNAVECGKLVDRLCDFVARGFIIVGWNSLGFDFRVLAEESGRMEECRRLAWGHVDPMYYFFCLRGFPIGLDAAAKGLGVKGKLEGMTGNDAPRLWANGDYETVIEYVSQDVKATYAVYRAIQEKGRFSWITESDRLRHQEIPGKQLLRVYEAASLPKPDTSWMEKAWTRSYFDGWLHG